MQNNSAVLDENPAAPAIEPEMLAKLKKEDMEQAVVERFRVIIDSSATRTTAGERKRSTYWQAGDEEC